MKRLRFTILGGTRQRETASTTEVAQSQSSMHERELPSPAFPRTRRTPPRSKQLGIAMLTITIGTLGFALSVVLVAAILAVPRYSGPLSPHFDGKRFNNLAPFVEPKLVDILRWKLFTADEEWPASVEFPSAPPPATKITAGARVTFINHATVLLQLDGLNVLTDPVYSERLGPIATFGVRRHKAPGIPFEALPKIDVVLISHNHYDHFGSSHASALELARPTDPGCRSRQPCVLRSRRTRCASGGARLVRLPRRRWGFVHVHPCATLVCAVARRSTSLPLGRLLREGTGCSDLLRGRHRRRPALRADRNRLGAPDVALLPIGAYAPRWFMRPQHIDPSEAVDAHLVLGAKTSIAIHFGCFALASEGMLAPVEQLTQALAARRLSPAQFIVLEHGDNFSVP
ncbi:MAG: MBL fold metallo-hydrolase [Polyangiaceae bacterium]